MGYVGENKFFSFRDGYCEALPGAGADTSVAAGFGRLIARRFKRFSIGCDGFRRNYILYAVCSGISECGRDVFVCENTDLPSFRFSYPLLSADCGIYVCGDECLRIMIFGENGFPLNSLRLSQLMNGEPAKAADRCGKITQVTSFRSIYANNIADSMTVSASVPAGVSCGSRSVRSLWLEFFTGDDNSLVFQVSDDGQRVNAYSADVGFISHEKLMLAYAARLARRGEIVYLPESFHFAADFLNDEGSIKLVRFSPEGKIPNEAVKQRFLLDPLFMCTHLAADRVDFLQTIRELPEFATVKREIPAALPDDAPVEKTISDERGRIMITRSGRNRLTLLAQAHSTESAAELCSLWSGRLRRESSAP